MTPEEAVAYVEGLDILGMRFGLERMHRVLAALGDPHRAYPCVHVVGTNGKTSTTAMAAAVLTAHGLRCGAYVSPHVIGWADRTLLDGRPQAPGRFAAAVGAVRDAVDGLGLADDDRATQFEVLTAAAFLSMAREGVDAAVVEAGLGGRWDATNVLDGGRVTVLTNIALEHTELLGDTITAIAGEKLAVAPDGSDRLVVGRLGDAAGDVEAVMAGRGLGGWRLGRDFAFDGDVIRCAGEAYGGIEVGPPGAFQRDNAAVAVAAARRFAGAPLDPGAVRAALREVRVPGRMEEVAGRPRVLMDGAHNPAGMAALVAALPDVLGTAAPVAVVSVLSDKDAAAMMAALAPACAAVVATRSAHRRAADPAVLAAAARAAGATAEAVDDPGAALARARALAGPDGAVLVCGSLYLLADLRPAVAPAKSPLRMRFRSDG
ncbi:MAG: bifunctional folylpolyglutamate synthase/dihydrofolate synthase [Thermoleophilia bacterium]|nr:bifunctional folylpolyglutamate synthase/dihydrofolate synthase [Thermoleophilia bacterium]